jgi:hypothetical protein
LQSKKYPWDEPPGRITNEEKKTEFATMFIESLEVSAYISTYMRIHIRSLFFITFNSYRIHVLFSYWQFFISNNDNNVKWGNVKVYQNTKALEYKNGM